jgi:hypothetical protein
MQIIQWFCFNCGHKTIWAEDRIIGLSSSTMWHCLYCGCERPPNEPGSPNEPASLLPPKPRDLIGVK